jgi:hypothetical protein
MEEIKDLLAFKGAGSFDRQFKVQVRKGFADVTASFVLGSLGVAGVLLIGFILFLCIAVANHSNSVTQQAASQPTTSQETAAEKTVKLPPSSPTSSPEMPTTPWATPSPQRTSIPTPDSRRKNWPDGRIVTHPEAFVQTYVVNVARDDTLKLRRGPGTRFSAVTEIPGDAAEIFAFDKDAVWDRDTWWYPIEWHGFRGYVGGRYLPHDQ